MFRFEGGFVTVGEFGSAPIRIHLLTPLGAFMFGGFRFDLAYLIGFVLIVLVHELGHAIAVRASGAYVQSVDVLPIGGVCRWQGSVSDYQRACIAFAGVWAQGVLFAFAWLYVYRNGPAMNPFGLALMRVFLTTNLIIMALNMLPFRPLDGAEAWSFFPLAAKKLWRGGRRRVQLAQVARLERKLDALDAREEKRRRGGEEPPRYLN